MSMSAEPPSLDVLAIAAFIDTESEYDLSKFPEAEFVESHEIQARVDPKCEMSNNNNIMGLVFLQMLSELLMKQILTTRLMRMIFRRLLQLPAN
ncbi:hypothetical protein ACFXTH_028826 [Malus domestica]